MQHVYYKIKEAKWEVTRLAIKTHATKFSHYPRLDISLPVRNLWSIQIYNERLHQTIADALDIDMAALGYKLPCKTQFTFLPDKKPIEVVEKIPTAHDFDQIRLIHAKNRKERYVSCPVILGPPHPAMQSITVEEPDVFIIDGYNIFWEANAPVNINRRTPSPAVELEENVNYTHMPGHSLVLWTKGANLYSHWMFDLFPKLHLITERSDFTLEQFDHVIGNKGPSPVNQVLLNEQPVLRDKYVRVKAGERFVFDHVTYITAIRDSFWTPGWIADLWHCKALIKASGTHRYRRIFLSRAKAGKRKLVNEQEIRSLLEKTGFEEIICEELDLYEVAYILNNAEVVIGLHGAGLANTIFCRPGTTIIELFGWHYSCEYWFIAESRGLNYAAVSCLGPDKTQGNWSDLRFKYSHQEINAADIYIAHDHLETSLKSLGIL